MKNAIPGAVASLEKASETGILDRTRSIASFSDAIKGTREPEKYDVLVLGSGTGGKLIAWTMASEGKRTASIDVSNSRSRTMRVGTAPRLTQL